MPLVLIWQYAENESKCSSGCVHWNCKTHCHGVLQDKGINRTKMWRNGHQIQLFLSQKSLKAQIARRWEDINGKCCYGTSPSLCFNFFPLRLEQVAAGVCVLNFNSCVCKASGCWTLAWQSRVGEQQCPFGVLNDFIRSLLSSFSAPLHLRRPLTQVTGPGAEFRKITPVTLQPCL